MLLAPANRVRTPPVQLAILKAKAVDLWRWTSSHTIGWMALACGTLSIAALCIATTDKIVVGPFSVPKEYEDRGYTSEAMSNAVVQFIHGNGSTVSVGQPLHLIAPDQSPSALSDGSAGDEVANISASIDGKHVVSSFDQSNIPDVKVPLTSFSFESLIETLRETVGRQPTRIAGEISALTEADSSLAAEPDPQRAKVLIRYKIEYPEPSWPVFGYHWWSRRTTTVTGTLLASGAEDVVQKLALITADGLGRRTLTHEDTQSRVRRLINRGNTYFGLNDYGRAERMYQFANSLEKSGHAYLCMGAIEEHEGNYRQAKDYYREATRVRHNGDDDDTAWALLYWGNLLLRENQVHAAIFKYRAITRLQSNVHTLLVQAAAQNNLGFVYSLKRDWTAAAAYFRAAEQIARTLHESAQLCAYSDGENSTCENAATGLELANNKAEAYLSIDSTNQLLALTHYGLAQTFSNARTADLSTVKKEYRASVQANPAYARAHYQLARIYISENNYKTALEELQKTIQLDAGFEQAYADWKALIDRWPTLPDKQKSVKPLHHTLARNYKNWGDAFTRAGNPDDAIERYCLAATLDQTYKPLCIAETN